MNDIEFLKNYFKQLQNLIGNEKYLNDLVKVKEILLKTHQNKKKTMIFGNGGSAAIASHFSVDLTKNANVRCTNYNESDLITCFSNDYGYDEVFSRQVSGLGNKGDLLFVISTSGKSKNIIKAAETAKNKKIKIIALTGNKKSKLETLSNICIRAPSSETAHIQEVHAILIHIICLLLEKRF